MGFCSKLLAEFFSAEMLKNRAEIFYAEMFSRRIFFYRILEKSLVEIQYNGPSEEEEEVSPPPPPPPPPPPEG